MIQSPKKQPRPKEVMRAEEKLVDKDLHYAFIGGGDVSLITWTSRFYVNKCETPIPRPGLVANILSRKLSMLR